MMFVFGLLIGFVVCNFVFKEDGTFRILQVADAHFRDGSKSPCIDVSHQYPCSSLNTTAFLSKAIAAEQPDLIVYTGDQIDGGSKDAKWSMDQIFKPAIDYGKPWAAVLGNHDYQAESYFYSRLNLVEYIASLPHSVTEIGPENLRGAGTYKLQLADDKGLVKFNMFFLDSMSFSEELPFSGWDWMHIEKVDWYVQNSDKDIPAISFYHIPLIEYHDVWPLNKEPVGLHCKGVHQESVCSAVINSGMFSAYLTQGDMKAVFVGHDHVNDYCCLYNGVTLCYGGGCGYDTYGKLGWPRRMRVIEFRDKGERIVSWKRLDDGKLSKTEEEILWFKV